MVQTASGGIGVVSVEVPAWSHCRSWYWSHINLFVLTLGPSGPSLCSSRAYVKPANGM
jgi:hypothetical protein